MGRGVTVSVIGGEGLRALASQVAGPGGWRCRCYASVRAFLESGDARTASCVVLGPDAGTVNILESLAELVTHDLGIPVVGVSPVADLRTVVRAMQLGCVDFIGRPLDPETLRRSVADAIEQGKREHDDHAARERVRARIQQLTPREREVMRLVASGRVNHEIAEKLGITTRTVEAHRGNVMRKMGARSLAELVRMAVEAGIGGLYEQRWAPHNGAETRLGVTGDRPFAYQ